MRITIIGAGAFGTALSKILLENGHELAFYDPRTNPRYTLRSACDFAEIFVFSAPSHTFSHIVSHIPITDLKKPFICTSKGFISLAPFRTLSRLELLSGPAFAKDIISRHPTTLTTTSVFTKNLFAADFLTYEISHDKLGILLCGTLKNIYSIYAGLCNIRPATVDYQDYLLQSLREIKILLRLNGAKPSTADLSCGFRDLALTSSTSRSRNYAFGHAIRTGQSKAAIRDLTSSTTIEGLSALRAISRSKDFRLPDPATLSEDLPIFDVILQYTSDYLC